MKFLLIVLLFASCQQIDKKYKDTYVYLGRNMETMQIDTIYSRNSIFDDNIAYNYVWVNTKNMWIANQPEFNTQFFIIKRIK